MNTLFVRTIIAVLIAVLLASAPFTSTRISAAPSASVTIPSQPVPYASDFATTVLQDSWDMSEFSDISQYLNGSGRHIHLSNPSVANGLFSGTSIGDYTNSKIANFMMLFPGYQGTLVPGKIGINYPIKTSQYSCLYIAMKVNSPISTMSGIWGDGFRVMWYRNNKLGSTTDPNLSDRGGGTVDIKMHVENLNTWYDPYPMRLWKLFKVDLTAPPNGVYGVRWQDAPEWQGLEIQPTMFKNISFQVDWVKLTNRCKEPESSYLAPITFTPASNIGTIWLNPSGTDRNIRIATDVNGSTGAYTLDTKGLMPGRYRVGFGVKDGNNVTCCAQWSTTELEINAPPKVNITRPSTLSGVEYNSNSWNMQPSTISSIECVKSYNYFSDYLELVTPPPASLPSWCRGGAIYEADPKIRLNTPVPVLPNSGYRFLTFKMYQSGSWQYVADGTMVRWMWTTSDGCTYVSRDIPIDVGWNTYTLDLFDPLNGAPVLVTSPCSQLTSWKNASTITSFRIDPNENYTGIFMGDSVQDAVPAMDFTQRISWIKLTKTDQVKRGSAFPIEFNLNESIKSYKLYYTNSLSLPTQWPVKTVTVTEPLPSGKKTFIPLVTGNPYITQTQIRAQWDTTSVAAGSYYICVEANDGLNTTTTCSSAPIEVTN